MTSTLTVVVERFEDEAWSCLGYWNESGDKVRQTQPFFVNSTDDYVGGLFGVLHDDWASLRPPGRDKLQVIDGLTPSPSPILQALFVELHSARMSWVMAAELLAYPWDEPLTRTTDIDVSHLELYEVTGVLPGVPSPESRTTPVDYTVEPSELWGVEWYKRTIPKLRHCDEEDRITFIFTEEVTP